MNNYIYVKVLTKNKEYNKALFEFPSDVQYNGLKKLAKYFFIFVKHIIKQLKDIKIIKKSYIFTMKTSTSKMIYAF